MESRDFIPGTDYVIIQSEDVYKYGVDSILLSSFAEMEEGKTLIDIGTGVGILALRCHYLYKPKRVYAYEIQSSLCALANKSVELNELDGEVKIINMDINDVKDQEKVDYIITNPPYVEYGRGIKNKNEAKLIAFHEVSLKLEEVFKFSKKHLKNKGKLFMINRANRLIDIIDYARKYNLEPSRLRNVHSFLNSRAKFVLVEFIRGGGKNFTIENPLYIYDEAGKYTKEIKEIYYDR